MVPVYVHGKPNRFNAIRSFTIIMILHTELMSDFLLSLLAARIVLINSKVSCVIQTHIFRFNYSNCTHSTICVPAVIIIEAGLRRRRTKPCALVPIATRKRCGSRILEEISGRESRPTEAERGRVRPHSNRKNTSNIRHDRSGIALQGITHTRETMYLMCFPSSLTAF